MPDLDINTMRAWGWIPPEQPAPDSFAALSGGLEKTARNPMAAQLTQAATQAAAGKVAEIKATQRQNMLAGWAADALRAADEFARAPFGYANPPVQMLSDALGVPGLQRTLDRVSYGEPLTTGKGQATRLRDDTVDALGFVPLSPRTALSMAGLAGAAGDAAAMDRAMMLFHGSPNKLEGGVFDLGRVGSNTHANTEGWGAYHSLDIKNAKRFGKNITKVDIPDDVAANVLLDWEKPISQQSMPVQKLAASYAADAVDPEAAAKSFFSWYKSIGRMDTAEKAKANRLMGAIYQDNGTAKLDIDKFTKIASEIAPKYPELYTKKVIGAGINNGKDLFDAIKSSMAGRQKSAAEIMNAFGIKGAIMNSDNDLNSAVIGARNVVIHDQGLLDDYTVRPKQKSSQ